MSNWKSSTVRNGQGVEQDYEQAFAWYSKSAEQGDSEAQVNVGYMYENGLGTKKNMKEAFNYAQLAAESDHVVGQFNLAEFYRDGSDFVTQDLEVALHWFSLSADQGDEEAAVERDKLLKLIK